MDNKEYTPKPNKEQKICPNYEIHGKYSKDIERVECSVGDCPYGHLDSKDLKAIGKSFNICQTSGLVKKVDYDALEKNTERIIKYTKKIAEMNEDKSETENRFELDKNPNRLS